MAPIAVLGEALIDLVETGDDDPRLARPGGSPYNVAIGLARLGQPAAFVGRLSRDPLGTVLRRHAERSGVDLSLAVDAPEATTIALVELADGVANYRFGVEGTADFRWSDAELAAVQDRLAALHFGSLASWLPPGDAAVARLVAARRERTLVSFDPNVRPHLQPDGAAARRRIEQLVPLAHVVKTSDEDLAHLYPGRDPDDVARAWLELGPGLVVVTRGGDGALARTAAGSDPAPRGRHRDGRHGGGRRRLHQRAARRARPARPAGRRPAAARWRAGCWTRCWTTPRSSPGSPARGPGPTRPAGPSSTTGRVTRPADGDPGGAQPWRSASPRGCREATRAARSSSSPPSTPALTSGIQAQISTARRSERFSTSITSR